MLKKTLFRIARSPAASYFIGFAFEHLSMLLPLERHYENQVVVVFAHPAPAWPLHLLAVPKKRIPSFIHLNLDDLAGQRIAIDIFEAIQTAARQKSLERFSVLVNGGVYQEVPQLHFHIASGGAADIPPLGEEPLEPPSSGEDRFTLGSALAYPHPNPTRRFHHVLATRQPVPGLLDFDFSNPAHTGALLEMLRAAQVVISKHSPGEYRLVLHVSVSDESAFPRFHLLSDDRVL